MSNLLDMSLEYTVSLKRHVDLISEVYDFSVWMANLGHPVTTVEHLAPVSVFNRFIKALLDRSKGLADRVLRSGRPLEKAMLANQYPGFVFDYLNATEAKLFSERKISKVFKEMEDYYSNLL